MPPSTINPNDPTVIALSKALAQHESGMNPNAVGDAGTSHGIAQWQGDTWKAEAQDVLGSADAPMSLDNQKAVLQTTVAKWKAQGLNPAQIAAKWNSGQSEGWENKIGTTTINGQQIHYDVPKYVKSVTELYQQYKGQSGDAQPQQVSQPTGGLPQAPVAPKPLLSAQDDLAGSTPATPPDNLGTDLSKRLQEGSAAAAGGVSALAQGNLHGAASGLLQTVGAAAGAAGDVVNRGLELIPGVKGIEGLIGKGVGKLAQTNTGQKVIQKVDDFAEKHPELSKDAGAVFNIATAIPILRGVGAIKSVAGDAISQGLKGAAEKSATEGFTAVVNSTKSGAKALSRNPDAIKTFIDERAIPTIEDGKYMTQEASEKLDEAISHIDDHELTPELEKASTNSVSDRMPFDEVMKRAEAEATDAQESFGPIKNELELIRKKYGDYPTLKQLNDAKRVVSRKISEAAYGSPDSSAMKVARSVLQQSVEEGASKLGLKDVGAINAKMRRLINAQKVLKHIDRKSVKTGLLGGVLKDVATGAGEVAGNATGIPLAGAYVGREAGGGVAKKIAGARLGILNRTGKDAVRTPLKKAGKKVIQGMLGDEAQQTTKSP